MRLPTSGSVTAIFILPTQLDASLSTLASSAPAPLSSADFEFVRTGRKFKGYLKRSFAVADAHELAALLAHEVDSEHPIEVQLWKDAEGGDEIALFEVVFGKVERVKSL